jgi:LysM repeat protein
MIPRKGRHRRPSRMVSAAAIAASGSTAAGMVILSATSAQAAPAGVTPVPDHSVVADNISAKIAVAALPGTVTVRSGDYLSKIAKEDCGNPKYWTGIFTANKGKISNPDLIYPGEQLKLDCRVAAVPAPVTVAADAVTVRPHHHYIPRHHHYYASSGGGYPGGSFGACVVARESGGNSQVMNSSGHYGLYQFSESTWEAYGGSAADFGHASVAEQERVFSNALARGGESNWSPYDGC